MKKVSLLILVSLILLLAFTSCDMLPESIGGPLEDFKVKVEVMIGLHEHAWTEASCESAKTCETCGEIEGEALGHNWSDATCDAPKTCSVCAKTEGAALGHKWTDATCESPKTCSVCKKTEGAALGHKWTAASCDSAKTCSVCKKTDGSALGHAFTNYVSNGDATCTADGTKTAKCDRCDETSTITDEGSALGHIYTYECDAHCARCYELTNESAAHNVSFVEAKAATCTELGNQAYYVCEYCGGCWLDEALTKVTNRMSVIVPMAEHEYFAACDPVCMNCNEITNPDAAHKIAFVEAKAATCTENGNNAYYTCEYCGNCWKDEALIQMTNRFYEIIVAPGHQYTYACDVVCNVCYEITNPEATHTVTHVEAKDATCFEDGNVEYWTCSDCGYFWLDEELTMNAVGPRLVIPAAHQLLVHQEAKEPACHYDGQIEHWVCYACELVWADEALTQQTNIKNVVLPAIGGDVVHVDAKLSCYEEGNIEYWYCEQCEQVWQNEALTQLTNFMNVKLPAGAHQNLVHFDAIEPACHYNGNVEYWMCYDCEQVWIDEALTQISNVKNVILPATGEGDLHHFEAIAPACHYAGNVEYWHCYTCEQVWTDEALTQLSNVKNVVLPATGDPAAIHVEAKAPTCTENGNIEYWYCEQCEQVWTDEALTQLSNAKNVIVSALGHDFTPSTCIELGACTVCGEFAPAYAPHNPIYDEFENKFFCENCDDEFTLDKSYYYNGSNDKYALVANGGATVDINDNGEYEVLYTGDAYTGNNRGVQPMLFLPTNANNHESTFVDFSCEKNAFGVISFRMKSSNTENFTVAVCKPRNDESWTYIPLDDGRKDSAWYLNSINLFTIGGTDNAENGAITLYGGIDANIPFTTIPLGEDGWSEWFEVKMFIQLEADYTMTVSYYVNGVFYNAYSRNLANPGTWDDGNPKYTIDTYKIETLYINGWTKTPGTGYVFTDLVFGYATESEWHFDKHAHSWIDATCDTPKTCELCGETEGEALGHTNSDVVKENVKPSTCTVKGSHEDVIYCTVCEAEVSRTLVEDDLLPHTEEVVPGKAPTCTEPGMTDGVKCTVCGITLTEQESIDPLTHIDENDDKICDECGADLACKHPETETVEGVNPTCTTPGYTEGVKCKVCGEFVSGHEEIKAPGHNYITKEEDVVPATCTEAGSHIDVVLCSVCGAISSKTPVVDEALKHLNDIALEAKEPTCTETGLTAGVQCSRCNEITTPQDVVPTIPHVGGTADCINAPVCTMCEKPYGSANGHTLVHNYVDSKMVYSCSDCDKEYTIEKGYYADGSDYNAIGGNGENDACGYTVGDAGRPSIITDEATGNKYYGLIKEHGGTIDVVDGSGDDPCLTGFKEQGQVWLPKDGPNNLVDFNAKTNSVGVISFKFNAYTTSSLTMQLVDSIYGDNDKDGTRIRWSAAWSIADHFFKVLPPDKNNVVYVQGWKENSGFVNLKTVQLTPEYDEEEKLIVDSMWTGWFDVKIIVSFDAEKDIIKLAYYIDGQYICTGTRPLTTQDDGINSIYLNMNSAAIGSGWMMDEFAFGYTTKGHNTLDGQAHAVTPATACDKPATCICGWVGEGLPHDLTEATCTAPATCKDCGATVGNKLPHKVNSSYEGGVPTYSCECGESFKLDTYNYNDGSTEIKTFFGPNGEFALTVENGYNKVVMSNTDEKYFNANGDQFMHWIPGQSSPENFNAFSCENNALGVTSLKIKAYTNSNTGVELKAVAERGTTSGWANVNGIGDAWDDCSFTLLKILPVTDNSATSTKLRAFDNTDFKTVSIGADKWTDWLDINIVISLHDNNTMTITYYVNGEQSYSKTADMPIYTKRITAMYINGYSKAVGSGYCLDSFSYGYTVNGHNTLDGKDHAITPATACNVPATCTCGWVGEGLPHDLTEATCTAPATCKDCGITVGEVLPHASFVTTINDGVATYTCADCNGRYIADGMCYYADGTNYNGIAGTGNNINNGYVGADSQGLPDNSNGWYQIINSMDTCNGGQSEIWLPAFGGQTHTEFEGLEAANNAIGFLSFKMDIWTSTTLSFLRFTDSAVRSPIDGQTYNYWSYGALPEALTVTAPTAEGEKKYVTISGWDSIVLDKVEVSGDTPFTGWVDITIIIKFEGDNISLSYYVSGEYKGTATKVNNIVTKSIDGAYISTKYPAKNSGIKLDDVVFGYTTNGLQAPAEAPLYNSTIDVADVESETLKAIALDKVKQWDQTAPTYVLANGKDGEEVEAIYFSRTTEWNSPGSDNAGFAENRWAVNTNVKSISFDYVVKGTLEVKDEDGAWIDGTVVPLGNSYIQIRTRDDANKILNGVTTDGYPEIPNSALTADGEWHTFSVTFDEPLDNTSHFLVKLYHLQGEFLIANINVTYAE